MSMYPSHPSDPAVSHVSPFITTAHTPYLNSVTMAKASIYGTFTFQIKKNKKIVIKRLAVGLSGTNGINIGDVMANLCLYHIKPYIVPSKFTINKPYKTRILNKIRCMYVTISYLSSS